MVDIKQYAKDGKITMFPRAGRVYIPRRKSDGSVITGLSKEQESRLGKALGKDLSPTSEFWDSYTMLFQMPDMTMKVNEKTPIGELFLTVAEANKLLAPDLDTYLDDMTFKNNTIFYIHDVEKQEKVKFVFLTLKSEVTSLIYNMRNDKDKMLFVLFKLGKYVLPTMPTESLYNMLVGYNEKISKYKPMEEFKKVLTIDNKELQSYYYVKQAMKLNLIVFNIDTKMYTFQDKALANNEEGVVKELAKKPSEVTLATLINEVNEHTANR